MTDKHNGGFQLNNRKLNALKYKFNYNASLYGVFEIIVQILFKMCTILCKNVGGNVNFLKSYI